MELKEIVNFRKLREYIEDSLPDEQCDYCPFRNLCPGNSQEFGCLVKRILSEDEDKRDLYDIERDELEDCMF